MITMIDTKIKFNPSDWNEMRNLMSKANEFDHSLFGVNENNEQVMLDIREDSIVLRTFQHNDWIRVNIYYEDGTVEEMFDEVK